MSINGLTISYPDFQLNTIINPEQFDANNLEIVSKINEIVSEYNTISATKIPATVIEGLTGDEVQTLMISLKELIDVHKARTDNPHGITPKQLGVYTIEELAPFLRGGDTVIKYEVFTIISSDDGNGSFHYMDNKGITKLGLLDENGGQTFDLSDGEYVPGQNRIECTINDTLSRSTASGGLHELSSTSVILTAPEGNGAEITFKYFEKVGITGTGLIIVDTVKPPIGYMWYKVIS